MVRYLIYRPIGTCVVAFTLFMLGIIVLNLLPVSLLPDISVPEITIQASYSNANARQIQQIVALPLRNQLMQLTGLDKLEAISNDGQVVIKLRFDYQTNINLAYLEANEKIDRLMETFPRDMPRPRVIKAGSGDIPVFQLNVWHRKDAGSFLELSNFCDNVLKRRLEQLPEIALVDITGLAQAEVLIKPNMTALQHMGISLDDLTALIKSRSSELGNVLVREGPYEYSISFDASLRNTKNIEDLYFKAGQINPRLVRLGDVAEISTREKNGTGLYSFNGKRAVGIAIIKQNDAQLLALRNTMSGLVKAFEKDYPELEFKISQDQTALLDLSISNLISSLTIGATLSFIIILFFMRDKRILLLIGLVIPLSLSITLLGFYILGLSINIVSLAGLVLGIGEIIDSAIIIIENIEQNIQLKANKNPISISEACIDGSEQVIKPLFTSVLTNSAVFLPLLFLSGIAGALFFEQAIAVSLALGISLLISYTFIPVLYFQFFKKTKYFEEGATYTSVLIKRIYNKVFDLAMERPRFMLVLWGFLILASAWVIVNIEKSGMPSISHTDLESYIDWNEPISPEESDRRLRKLMKSIQVKPVEYGLFVGQQQFLLNTRIQQSSTEVLLVAKMNSSMEFDSLSLAITQKIKKDFPLAIIESRPALNVFEQLFQTSEPPLRILLSANQRQSPPPLDLIDSTGRVLMKNRIPVQLPTRMERIQLTLQTDRLLLYGVDPNQVLQVLRTNLNNNNIGMLHSEQKQIPILLGSNLSFTGLQDLLNKGIVISNAGSAIPLNQLVKYSKTIDYASLYLGRDGTYVPLTPTISNENVSSQTARIEEQIQQIPRLSAIFTGSYYRNLSYIRELSAVIIIVIGMLFFILAAQFESLLQPLIVLLTIIFGTTGALFSLYWAGNSLNIMSAIGLIVLIGLLDNDSILKIDTMNRDRNKQSIMQTIRLGGEKRLQSQIITFLTTVLGLVPILFSSGLGAELQKPLALAVIGGMCVGVLISWTFIPLMYYWLNRIS